MQRTHTIHTQSGRVFIKESDGHLTISTERLNVPNVSIHLTTVWRDTDLAVCVNGKWLDGAYEAGQHAHIAPTPKGD